MKPFACVQFKIPSDSVNNEYSIFGASNETTTDFADLYLRFIAQQTKEEEYILSELMLQLDYEQDSA